MRDQLLTVQLIMDAHLATITTTSPTLVLLNVIMATMKMLLVSVNPVLKDVDFVMELVWINVLLVTST